MVSVLVHVSCTSHWVPRTVAALYLPEVRNAPLPEPQSLRVLTFLPAALFALYGAQLGAVQAGLEAEREIGLLGAAARSGLVVVESRFGPSFRGASRDAVDDAIEEGSLHLLGRARSSWSGFWGFVARQTYRALARRFEVALIAAHLEVATEAGDDEVTVSRIAERGRDLFARSLGDLASLVLGVELVALVVGQLVVGLGWYPLAARFVTVVSRTGRSAVCATIGP